MDVLCDTLLLEEILPRLPPKPLLRLSATSRRYNALARRPSFAARYWRHAGVFLQPAGEPHKAGVFLTAPSYPGAELMLPGPEDDLAEDGIVHSAAGGLLLCSRGHPTRLTARYYVCNPVTRQRVALPEPGDLCYNPQCGLLTVVAGDATRFQFQVVVIEESQFEDTFLRLKVFSSDTGRWNAKHLWLSSYPSLPFEHDFRRRPVLGPSGAAYWIQRDGGEAIVYDSTSNTLRAIHLPPVSAGGSGHCICVGERHGSRGLPALEVWDSETVDDDHAHAAWVLAHRVAMAELLGQSSDEAAWHRRRIKPVGFHPTDVDVVFLALPSGVAAYSIEHGTMDLQCTLNCFAAPADVFAYVHPPYPVQIPAIQNLTLELLPRKRKADDDTYSKS
ncbi:unnamed protein product [Urochloa decumbens]|uniref:F-box protein At3g26010-like beta-propeller domain-containing protein n=1 Tax=Urochloa decumbens TaxID=240449 RepID=A0ABC8ZDC4_9POAL